MYDCNIWLGCYFFSFCENITGKCPDSNPAMVSTTNNISSAGNYIFFKICNYTGNFKYEQYLLLFLISNRYLGFCILLNDHSLLTVRDKLNVWRIREWMHVCVWWLVVFWNSIHLLNIHPRNFFISLFMKLNHQDYGQKSMSFPVLDFHAFSSDIS